MSGKKLVLGFAFALVLSLVVVALVGLSGRSAPPPPVRPIAIDALPEASGPAAQLLVAKCTSCHALPDPASHTKAEWPPVIRRMASHSAARFIQPPSTLESAAIADYLSRHASDAH